MQLFLNKSFLRFVLFGNSNFRRFVLLFNQPLLIMKDLNQDALKIILNIFITKKFKNVAELTTTYNQKELKVLADTSKHIIHLIILGEQEGVLLNHFKSEFEAFMFKSFVESQSMFFTQAVLHNEGALILGFTSLEGKIVNSILHQN